MTEAKEAIYLQGQRTVWLNLLHTCLEHLGYELSEAQRVAWITEREQAIALLREACAAWGDNNWDESLHLADIIDKHLLQSRTRV